MRWPLQLQADAADYGYSNNAIQTALYDAYSSIYDIIIGAKEHPLAVLFDKHVKEKQDHFLQANPERDFTTADLFRFADGFAFPVPVPAGDSSLIDEFLADLMTQLKRWGVGVENSELALTHIGPILFRLVIVRQYLSRPPENDLNIFDLVANGRIVRLWTPHEQALATCHGEPDTAADAAFATAPDPALWLVDVVYEDEPSNSSNEPLVMVNTPSPVVWTVRPGLCGGSRVPRCYRPLHLPATQPGPRPNPRPAYRAARTSDVVAETSKAGGESGKRAIEDVEAAEMPSERKPPGASAGQASSSRMPGAESVKAPVRRSARNQATRKV